MITMSVSQVTPANKVQKGKRNSMNRPASTIDGDVYIGFRNDIDNESPGYRIRLHALFKQIEKEFDLLYQENQNCKSTTIDMSVRIIHISIFLVQDKIDLLNEKIETIDKQSLDCIDFDNNYSKTITKKRKYLDICI